MQWLRCVSTAITSARTRRDMAVAYCGVSCGGKEYRRFVRRQAMPRYRDKHQALVAHEAAHHWWFQIVHNDPVSEPWLDGALAEYAMRLYFKRCMARIRPPRVRQRRWRVPLSLLAERNADVNVNRWMRLRAARSTRRSSMPRGAVYAQPRGDGRKPRLTRFPAHLFRALPLSIVSTEDWLAELRSLDNPEAADALSQWVQPPSGIAR